MTVEPGPSRRQFLQAAAGGGAALNLATSTLSPSGTRPQEYGRIRLVDLLNSRLGEWISNPLEPDASRLQLDAAGNAYYHIGGESGTIRQLTPQMRVGQDIIPWVTDGVHQPEAPSHIWYQTRHFVDVNALHLPQDPNQPGLLTRLSCNDVRLEDAQLAPARPSIPNGPDTSIITSTREINGGTRYISTDSGIPWPIAVQNMVQSCLTRLNLPEINTIQAQSIQATIQDTYTPLEAVGAVLLTVPTNTLIDTAGRAGLLTRATIERIASTTAHFDEALRPLVVADIAHAVYIEEAQQTLQTALNRPDSQRIIQGEIRPVKAISMKAERDAVLAAGLSLTESEQTELGGTEPLSDQLIHRLAVEFAALQSVEQHVDNINGETLTLAQVAQNSTSDITMWNDGPFRFYWRNPLHAMACLGSNGTVNGSTDTVLFSADFHSHDDPPVPYGTLLVGELLQRNGSNEFYIRNNGMHYVVPPSHLEPFGTRQTILARARGKEGGIAPYTFCIQGTDDQGNIAVVVDRWPDLPQRDNQGYRQIGVDAELILPSHGNDTERITPETQFQYSVTSHNGNTHSDAPTIGIYDPTTSTFSVTTIWGMTGDRNPDETRVPQTNFTSASTSLGELSEDITAVHEYQLVSEGGALYACMLVSYRGGVEGEESRRFLKLKVNQPKEPTTRKQFLPKIFANMANAFVRVLLEPNRATTV